MYFTSGRNTERFLSHIHTLTYSLQHSHRHTHKYIPSPSWTKFRQQTLPLLHGKMSSNIFYLFPSLFFFSVLVAIHNIHSWLVMACSLEAPDQSLSGAWFPWTSLPQLGLPFLPQHSQSSPISFTSLIPAGQAPLCLSKASLSTSNQWLCVDGAGGGGWMGVIVTRVWSFSYAGWSSGWIGQ